MEDAGRGSRSPHGGPRRCGSGQPDVHDRGVQLVGVRLPLVGVPALSDHLETRVRRETGETLAQQHAVLGDGYAHGISAFTRVPPAARGPRSRPPSASTRSASPRRPVPRSLSAPYPVVDDLDDEQPGPGGPRQRSPSWLRRACRRSQGSRRRRSTQPPRSARPRVSRSTSSRTGTEAQAASDSSATSNPCPLTTAG